MPFGLGIYNDKATAHCQNLGQQRSEPDPGFDYLFFYILVLAPQNCSTIVLAVLSRRGWMTHHVSFT